MEKLYYLLDKDENFRNFIIFCRQECELKNSDFREAIIYTEEQMDVARRYFRRKRISVTPVLIDDPKIEKHARQHLSKRGFRKRFPERYDLSNGETEIDGGGMDDVGRGEESCED